MLLFDRVGNGGGRKCGFRVCSSAFRQMEERVEKGRIGVKIGVWLGIY